MMGALTICFLDPKLRLHSLSRIRALPASTLLPGVSPLPVRGSIAAATRHDPDFLETTKLTLPLAECPRDGINYE